MKTICNKDNNEVPNYQELDDCDKKLKEYMDATSERIEPERKSEPIEYYGIDEDSGPVLVAMMFGIFVALALIAIVSIIVCKAVGL